MRRGIIKKLNHLLALGLLGEDACLLSKKCLVRTQERQPKKSITLVKMNKISSNKHKTKQDKSKKKKTKELKLNPTIAKHDVEVKTRHAKGWIDKECRVKIVMIFRGRMIMHKEIGMATFNAIVKSLTDHGATVGSPMKDENGTVTIILDSKKSHNNSLKRPYN